MYIYLYYTCLINKEHPPLKFTRPKRWVIDKKAKNPMSNQNSNTNVLQIAKWSVTTTCTEKQAYRDSIDYTDTPRTAVEGICTRNEKHALNNRSGFKMSLLKGKPSADLQKSIDFDNWLAELSGKTPAQFRRELTRRD